MGEEIIMSTMSDKDRFEAALKMESVDRVSIACPLQTGTVALMDASGASWPEAHRDPEKMAKLAIAAHEIAGLESVRVPFHNDYEAEAMGSVIGDWKREMQPQKVHFAVNTLEDIDYLRVPDPKNDAEMPFVLKAVSILSQKVGRKLPVIAAICAPFELVVRLRSLQVALNDLMEYPNQLKKMLKKCVETEVEYGKALVEAGASTITLVDGISSCLVDQELGTKYYVEFSQPYEREVITKLDTLTVLHICSDATCIIREMGETGANGLSIDSPVDVVKAKRVLGKRAAIVGNVNSLRTLGTGTVEKVKKEAKEALTRGVDVLSPGCGFSPRTPLVNMKALKVAISEYY